MTLTPERPRTSRFFEATSVDLGFRSGNRIAQLETFAESFDAKGEQNGAFDVVAFQAYLLVAGIQKDKYLAKGRSSLGFKSFFEFGGLVDTHSLAGVMALPSATAQAVGRGVNLHAMGADTL